MQGNPDDHGQTTRFTLRNGAVVVVRPIMPDDKERLI
jgi:hypothetical protein